MLTEADKKAIKKWREKNKEYYKNYLKKYKQTHRWSVSLYQARLRCNNPNTTYYYRYGGRGIKCFLTLKEIKQLWFRDKAYLMKRPSIDRKNNDGDYTFKNCRFMERKDNTLRYLRGHKVSEKTKEKIRKKLKQLWIIRPMPQDKNIKRFIKITRSKKYARLQKKT